MLEHGPIEDVILGNVIDTALYAGELGFALAPRERSLY
jgi:hypothetical protein